MIRHHAVILRRADDTGNMGFHRDEYNAVFGTQNGGLLYTEFESICSRPALSSEGGNEGRLMKVYVSIWRVLGASWTEYIASNKKARKECLPACKRPLFSVLWMCD